MPRRRSREEVQLVLRTRPRVTLYARRTPVTYALPTPAQAEVRYLFAEAASRASELTAEEVARLVGGEVVVVDGKERIRMPDGRVLLKQMAYVRYALSGYRSGASRVEVPRWLEELSRRYYQPVPAEALRKAGEVRAKIYKS